MAKTKQVQHTKGKKGGMNNATAGAIGAAVGGIVGATAGIALSDKDKRRMIINKMDDLKRYIGNALDEIAHMSSEDMPIISAQGSGKTTTAKKTKTTKRTVN